MWGPHIKSTSLLPLPSTPWPARRWHGVPRRRAASRWRGGPYPCPGEPGGAGAVRRSAGAACTGASRQRDRSSPSTPNRRPLRLGPAPLRPGQLPFPPPPVDLLRQPSSTGLKPVVRFPATPSCSPRAAGMRLPRPPLRGLVPSHCARPGCPRCVQGPLHRRLDVRKVEEGGTWV
jgi:hypothetical protein